MRGRLLLSVIETAFLLGVLGCSPSGDLPWTNREAGTSVTVTVGMSAAFHGAPVRGIGSDFNVSTVIVTAFYWDAKVGGPSPLARDGESFTGSITVHMTGLLKFCAVARDAGSVPLYQGSCSAVVDDAGADVVIAMSLPSAGALDTSFGAGGKVSAGFPSVSKTSAKLQSDGKIVIAGTAGSGAASDFIVARYNADGSPDTSFGASGQTTTDFLSNSDSGNAVAIQPDGSIVVAGSAYDGTSWRFATARYVSGGILDSSFGGSGKVTISFASDVDECQAVAIQPDGKIVVAGRTYTGTDYDIAVARMNPDGSLDSGFGTGGKVTTNILYLEESQAVAIQPDGKILVAGSGKASGYNFELLRYNTNGTLDSSFDSDGAVTTDFYSSTDYGQSIALQPDGKIVVAGWSFDGADDTFALVRYHPDGYPDSSFGGSGRVVTRFNSNHDDRGFGVAVQPDGKIVVVGRSGPYNGIWSDFAVARYRTDGTLDSTFGASGTATTSLGTSGLSTGYSVELQPDGKIIVVGRDSVYGNSCFGMVRYWP